MAGKGQSDEKVHLLLQP